MGKHGTHRGRRGRLLPILLCLAALTALCGCGGGTQEKVPPSDPAISAAESTAPAQAPEPAASASPEAPPPAEPPKTYAELIFDPTVLHRIDVEIAGTDWEELLQHPADKTKYRVNVTVDGETVPEASFSTKGNTSLSEVAHLGSERYSFKINFHKFRKDQTYHGLDKLHLNNLFADATDLKDFFSYHLMAEAGVPAPLCSFAELTINGEPHGLYLAVEEIGDSFLARNGLDGGALYKPETSHQGHGDAPKAAPDAPREDGFPAPPDFGDFPAPPQDGGFPAPPDFGNDPLQSLGSGGSALLYQDDSPESYPDIFDNAETKVRPEDQARLIQALKQLSAGDTAATELREVVGYFAAHNFVINFDGYTGANAHNYYLYESGGRLSIFPWDYNLAFGGFQMDDAARAVNWPLDDPLKDTSPERRPLWAVIAEDQAALEEYHSAVSELLKYFESGRFDEDLEGWQTMILPAVEADPGAFYTVEEFHKAVETLRSFCHLRAESLRGQLDGRIPATEQGQNQSPEALIDPGTLSLADMGEMKIGGGMPGQPGAP